MKKKPWTVFTSDAYAQTISGLVHFSAKTVNSNTPSYGVRLGADDYLDLPYVALSTLQLDAIPVDYEKNAGKTATVVAQVSAVLENRLADHESAPSADVDAIRAAVPLLQTRFELPSASVGMRLRQVIVQDAGGADLALTPLQSAGFSALLESRLKIEQDAQQGNRRARGYLGIGGANPQNVGRHVRSMSRPLWFKAPAEDMQIRRAMAVHFRGISLRIPAEHLLGYYQWRQQLLQAHHGSMPTDGALRADEVNFLSRMVVVIVARADEASQLLDKHLNALPGGLKTALTLNLLMRGLLDGSLRHREWKREFAQKLHLEIIDSKVFINGERRSLGIGQSESTRWVGLIEDML